MISEGWVEWPGGECPVAWNTCVEYKTRGCTYAGPANALRWDHTGGGGDITKYRVLKREREEQMKETIERLSAYEIQFDREIAAAMKQQAEQIDELAAALAAKDEALRDTLDAIGALTKPHELIGYGLDQADVDAIFSALALQPHASIVARIVAADSQHDAEGWNQQ